MSCEEERRKTASATIGQLKMVTLTKIDADCLTGLVEGRQTDKFAN